MIGKFINVTTQLQIRVEVQMTMFFLSDPYTGHANEGLYLWILMCIYLSSFAIPNLILSPLTLQIARSRIVIPSDTTKLMIHSDFHFATHFVS